MVPTFCEFKLVTTKELSGLIRTSGRKSCALDPIPASVLRGCFGPGVNVIKVFHLYFTRVAIVSLAENNSCTCKLQV